tara:strand:- start:364 stop:612 length:249 start_codon:yes stop_codon:yes gene_type:complete
LITRHAEPSLGMADLFWPSARTPQWSELPADRIIPQGAPNVTRSVRGLKHYNPAGLGHQEKNPQNLKPKHPAGLISELYSNP